LLNIGAIAIKAEEGGVGPKSVREVDNFGAKIIVPDISEHLSIGGMIKKLLTDGPPLLNFTR
jgi:hypothetical protein